MAELREIFDPGELFPFLASLGLSVPKDPNCAVGFFEDGKLVACGCLSGDVLQGIGVAPGRRGEGLAAAVVTELIKRGTESGFTCLRLFTKPDEARRFEALGFRPVAEARPYAALLEWGRGGIEEYEKNLHEFRGGMPGGAAAVVVNCNPFTLGHRHLVETAAAGGRRLYVIVVEEDRSLFPYRVRLELIRRGTADLENVIVVPGGRYVISNLTFPTYFTRDADLTKSQASLDAEIFARRVAPALGVSTRFVGEEPYCETTREYNGVLKSVLPARGVEIREIPRLEVGGRAVSASDVRALIRADDFAALRPLVPETTYGYLVSPEAIPVVSAIRSSSSRH